MENESQSSQQTETTTETTGSTEGASTQTESTTEQQTTDGGSTTTEESSEGKKVEGAPEAYADFTLPEGVTLDKAALEQAIPIFKEMNLTQEQAQKLVALQSAGTKKANEAFEADKQSRLDAIKADKELGGDNAGKVNETVARALNTFLNEAEQKDLTDHINRFGTSPGLARLLYRVGQKMTEDIRHDTGGDDTQISSAESRINSFYSTMKK